MTSMSPSLAQGLVLWWYSGRKNMYPIRIFIIKRLTNSQKVDISQKKGVCVFYDLN
jgi:hypothetical protein